MSTLQRCADLRNLTCLAAPTIEDHHGDEPGRSLREWIGHSAGFARIPSDGVDYDGHWRTRRLYRSATRAPLPARGRISKIEVGRDFGMQFVPGTRACSARNRLHVNLPMLRRFAQSYMFGNAHFGGLPWRRSKKIVTRVDRPFQESCRDTFR